MPSARSLVTFAAGAAVGGAVAGAWGSPAGRFARMTGSSIADASAAGWITDFVNAAYYRRAPQDRSIEDLRLANMIVTTRWARHQGRRLRGPDVVPFHRAFGRHRFDTGRSPRGTLDRDQLLEGAERLFGAWFADAQADPARRGWGIAFATESARADHDPGRRLALARIGALTPAVRPPEEQVWHTYDPVEVPSAGAVLGALSQTETWPDYQSALGRFTPLRRSDLPGQTFEIEVAAGTSAGRPVFTRGYVTITRVASRADPDGLRAYVDELNVGLQRFGGHEPPAVPDDADPVLGFDLTTHEGHFIGAGNNRLVLYEQDGRAYARAAGTWDRMPWHIQRSYDLAGRAAQAEFWGETDDPDSSMLHQIAIAAAAAEPASA